MRKLKITELNRISIEEFKEAEKLPRWWYWIISAVFITLVLYFVLRMLSGGMYLPVWHYSYSAPS